MDVSRVRGLVLMLCATWLQYVRCIDLMRCDFGDPDDLLINNALVMCHMDIDDFSSAVVTCPRRLNNIEYTLHPQPYTYEYSHLKTYVSDEGTFRSVALSEVFLTESPVTLASMGSDELHTALIIDIPNDQLFAMTERRWIFICGPRDLTLSDTLQRHLDRLNGTIEIHDIPWNPPTSLSDEISKMGHALGVFILYGERTYSRLQGCGSRPSPLFAPDNQVTVDPVTGVTSCVVDPVSDVPIGFLCDGLVEPYDCMRSLIDHNGEVVAAPEPHPYRNFHLHRPWVVGKYFDKFVLPQFGGECRCIDPGTGQVKAKIEVRGRTEYVCDIASKIFRHRVQPIRGPWCSVVLHPGSTLTIRFPIESPGATSEDEFDMDIDEASTSGPPSEDPPRYLFKTEFLPNNLTTLRQLSTAYDTYIYEEVGYQMALAGDALELDTSQMSHGEVKLKYHSSKPLALKAGTNSFLYHWTLNAINNYIFERIGAAVNVSFALTHYYDIVGCEQGPQTVFDPELSKDYCAVKPMGNGIGPIYECAYQIKCDGWQVGIHCRPGEELLPDNCESTGYDLSSNKVMMLPESVCNATTYRIPGLHVFDIGLNGDIPFSYACACVDQRGYETSRLILKYMTNEVHAYKVRHAYQRRTSLPHVLMPWREVGLAMEGATTPEYLMMSYVPQRTIKMEVGRTLKLQCENDFDTFHTINQPLNIDANTGRNKLKWFPDNPQIFFYAFSHTPDGPKLMPEKYEHSIAMTEGALEITYSEQWGIPGYLQLAISSHRGAILISKNPRNAKAVSMAFVCGKRPEPSDLSIISDGITNSSASEQPNFQIMRLGERYTWHVVEVAVETTDPYVQGCGVTSSSDELFKPETPKLNDANGRRKFGCKIDLQVAHKTAFYCPAPYALDPPNCFDQVYVDGEVKNVSNVSNSLVKASSNHFVILRFDSELIGPGETLRQTPPLECHCVTTKGVVLSTIQIENYYAKK
ncbi:hypothetical protein BBBOND_0311480 [Babesia bigemina]|uniref:6-Cys domain-containing protein n=1 Tax=Babesia bigemina TaxID=5866 RepID=A0A061DEG6_BABBI|nr:hypothetical protein BBBOND_0311480 [Babesia bigemina]CDR97245.1 hypothetical protein BBBOND_0311480 [Babesia bigemina]|eukprot:XP_012769431.1 hypothetical protein BBBOND_0311480 [Babesia bigemina]